MVKLTVKSLTEHANDLLGNNANPERVRELFRECFYGFVREPGHVSHSHAAHIGRIDKILGNFGCEGMILGDDGRDVSGECCDISVKHDIHYSNTGDTYGLTIMYYNGKLMIGDWGSIVESIS